jgi:hypothetical protein
LAHKIVSPTSGAKALIQNSNFEMTSPALPGIGISVCANNASEAIAKKKNITTLFILIGFSY